MAAKLGDFFVNIGTKADTKGIQEVSSGLEGLIGQAKKLAVAYLSFKTAKQLATAAATTIQDAAELSRLSQDLGIATEDLEAFGRAFEIVGAGADEAFSAIRGLTKLIPSLQMGDENLAEAFGLLGMGPNNLGTDPLKNFDNIRKRFQALNSAQQLYFVNTIGLGEKSLRVLRLNDEEYQNLLDTAREAPLLNKEQSKQAEKFARMSTRASYSVGSAGRNAALRTEPVLTSLADAIRVGGINGAEFVDAVFRTEDPTKTAGKTPSEIRRERTKKQQEIIDDPNKEGFFRRLLRLNKSAFVPLLGSSSPSSNEAKKEMVAQQAQNWDGRKSIIINNNFQNKTDIQIQDARDLQRDLAKHVPSLVGEVFGTTMKQASENFKKGAIQ